MMTITLSVDAMGGDIGLDVTLPAAAAFLDKRPDVHLILVGDEAQIRARLAENHLSGRQISVQHASEVVGMDEAPQLALKNKKDSSMRVAVNLVKEGRAQAAVSAGNTGALMATARFVLKTLPGIDRPAIAKFLPAADGRRTLALDLGANVDCTAEQLLQFAVMGSELVRSLDAQNASPRIGLLNIGTEDIKGNEVVEETVRLLRESGLNFIGNVEADSIFSGAADVVVADGFVGNIVLKTIESSVKFMGGAIRQEFGRSTLTRIGALAAKPALSGIKARFDPRRYNGAIFLGLRGIVIKSHGGTDAEGFAFALEEAYHEAEAGSTDTVGQGVATRMSAFHERRISAEQAAAGEV